jgi:hypothetical protein
LALIQHVTGATFGEVLRQVADAVGLGDASRCPPPLKTAPKPGPSPEPEKRTTLHPDWAARWEKAKPITEDSPAGRYLIGRGCALPPSDGDLRWHPRAKHWKSGHIGPALIALITDAVTCRPVSLHFTWLASDGAGKADLDPPRLTLPGHSNIGVVRLWPDDAVTTGLLVGEGIESTLTVAHGFQPAWATLNAGNLAKLPPLDGIETLTVAADNDKAGIQAARVVARCWRVRGHEVRVWKAPEPNADPNDHFRKETVS